MYKIDNLQQIMIPRNIFGKERSILNWSKSFKDDFTESEISIYMYIHNIYLVYHITQFAAIWRE